MKIISASIDLTKIDKTQIIEKDKDGNPFKNGAKYLNIQIFLNSEPDQYGNHCSIAENQTKEQREAKVPKKYLGNGKIVFSNSASETPNNTASQQTPPNAQQSDSDLPF